MSGPDGSALCGPPVREPVGQRGLGRLGCRRLLFGGTVGITLGVIPVFAQTSELVTRFVDAALVVFMSCGFGAQGGL